MIKINGDGTLDFEEFCRILRHLSPGYFMSHRSKLIDIFGRFAQEFEEGDDPALDATAWAQLCSAENLWQTEGREALTSFYQRRGGHKRGLPESYEELVSEWNNKLRARILNAVECANDEGLLIYFDRINNGILVSQTTSSVSHQTKIWMNYKILEAESERLHAEGIVGDRFMPPELNTLEKYLGKLGLKEA